MRLIAEDRGIEIDLSTLETAVVHGERARLKQVIVNLLDNAIRFTSRGGSVTLHTAMDNSGCVFEVSDTGIGIPSSGIPHVFDRFVRAEEAPSREDGGAGLGLSIVKSICSLHGVEVEVDSDLGSGSCFRVEFTRRLTVAYRGDASSTLPSNLPPGREGVGVMPTPNGVSGELGGFAPKG